MIGKVAVVVTQICRNCIVGHFVGNYLLKVQWIMWLCLMY